MVIFLLSGSLHGFGLYILNRVRPHAMFNEIQRNYLMHLSICELFISIENSLVEFVLRVTLGKTPDLLNRLMDIGSFTWFIGLMILMTIDRFFTVYYPLRYPVYWNKRKSKFAVGGLLSVSAVAAVVYAFILMETKWRLLVRAYYWFSFLVVFLVIILITYLFILKKIFENNSSTSAGSQNHSRFKRSLLVPSLIISTFILLWAVPFLVSFVGIYVKLDIPAKVWQFAIIIFGIGFCLDAITYIFLQPSLKNEIKKIFFTRASTDVSQR